MRKLCTIFVTFLLIATAAYAQRWEPTDSVDVLHTSVDIDFSGTTGAAFSATAEVSLRLLRPCPKIKLLLNCAVDSIAVNGQPCDCRLDSIGTGDMAAGDTMRIFVAYHYSGSSITDWGGMHLDPTIYYNLGISFTADPHSVGRAWFPTQDNFTDKGTYTLTVTSYPGWTTRCGGLLTSERLNPDGTQTTTWHIGLPTPAYLVSVAVAPWKIIERDFRGLDSTYQATLAYTTQDSTEVYHTFDVLDSVIPAFERAFGPYQWRRIGYNATPIGSMEHVMNISLAQQVIGDGSDDARFGNMCHELAHAWFGNTLTCAESGDMWINEGGASFCEEVAVESCLGRKAADQYYQNRLDKVIRTAHLDDNGYRPLHGMPHSHTYGTTTYKKGSLAWHSLRGVMGDSLFYASMRRLFANCIFGNLDAYGLLDSLEAYSGLEHNSLYTSVGGQIFSSGFLSYHIDSVAYAAGQATVHMSCRRIGTEVNISIPSRVPVVFFDWAFSHPVERWVEFDSDGSTTATFSLPYEPVYWVIDYYHRIANAITSAEFDGAPAGVNDGQSAHFALGVTSEAVPTRVIVEHHWGDPGGSMPAGVLNTAKRYWVVTGYLPCDGTYTGQFQFCREGYRDAVYPHLDNGFYHRRAQLDSMALLYRHTPADPWAVATRHHAGNANEGRFTDVNLRPGEYMLAIIDTALIAVPHAEQPALSISPNPANGSFKVTFDGPPSTLAITDLQGRTVYRQSNVASGQLVRPNLPAGNYIVKIENNFLSLQSQLIIL
ncbi:MAG: T9SS type A sorting domain-containing protein [Bacteroidales bacterium]|nr:T9SS type A sorting domain-containing protein [Bacteroidales bacterium]